MLGLIAVTPLVFKYFVGDAFKPGQKYAIYLVISFFFWAIYNMLLPFLLNKKKNKLIMSISIVGMLLSIGLNFYNVRHFGALGATYTSIIVFATMCLLTLYSVHRIYNLKDIFLGRENGGSLQNPTPCKTSDTSPVNLLHIIDGLGVWWCGNVGGYAVEEFKGI